LGDIFKVGVATLFPVGKARLLIPFVIEIIIAISIISGFLLLMKLYSIYEFNLLFPVVIYLFHNNFSQKEKNKLLILVFIQTDIMQTFGYYKW